MDPTTNWNNWLAGQSYLETSYQDEGNPSSSARGYFQFINPTARRAIAAGLPDPRAGGYGDQANAAKAYIQRFHPDAANAIEGGDFHTATNLLRGEWPSLPGGSQQQNPSRYATWSRILSGGGPRPDGTTSSAGVASPPMNTALAQNTYSPQGSPTMSDQSTLFGGNPTPVGAFGGLGRMLGIGSEPELGRRLINAGAALQSVGSFGKNNSEGAAALMNAANQPHFDVVTDALGNRYILDKRTGAITMPGMNGGAPNGMSPGAAPAAPAASPGFNNQAGGAPQQQQAPQQPQPQQGFKPSGDPNLDTVTNSPLGAVEAGKAQIEAAQKDKDDLEGAADSAKQLHDLAVRQLEIAQSGKIVQGPGVMNWIKEHGAEALGNGNPFGIDLDLQNQYDLNNKAMSTLMGSSILNNARIAGPELRFLQLIHPDSEYTQGANVGALQDIIQRTERMQAHASIGRQYRALGPNFRREVDAYDKANPLYSNHGGDTATSKKAPLSSFWQNQQ